jgi:hypothetical protein
MAQGPDRLQHAWQVHQAVQNWTNQAETKATFLLTIESALFVFFFTRLGDDKLFEQVTRFERHVAFLVIVVGMLGLLIAIVMLVQVVYPRLREKELARERWRNAIYFGHLAGQDPKAIENTLKRRDPLEQLARQLRVMGDIAMQKHQLLKQSIVTAAWGLGLVILSFALWTTFTMT